MRLRVLVLALGLALVVPASADANAYTQVLSVLVGTGHLDPCRFSSSTLSTALGQIPPDVEQYAPELRGAIRSALSARAGGACDKKKAAPAPAATTPATPTTTSPETAAAGSTPGGSTPSGGSPVGDGAPAAAAIGAAPAPPSVRAALALGAVPSVPAGATARGDAPLPLLALGALALLAVLGTLLAVLPRRLGLGARWAPGAGHALREAGHRTGGRWGDFGDFLRSRR